MNSVDFPERALSRDISIRGSLEKMTILGFYIGKEKPSYKKVKDQLWNTYKERNQLVLLATKTYPSHLSKHRGKNWENDWRNIVCVHTPYGQATWHIHDSELPYFKKLAFTKDHWDGHTTNQKYGRLRKIKRPKTFRLTAKNYDRN